MKYKELRIGASLESAQLARIQASVMQAGRPMLSCTLATDRDSAAALTGQMIYVQRSRVEAGRGDDLLWSELVGAEVVDVGGAVVGRVYHVYNAGASDIIEVRSGLRSLDIPLVTDYIDTSKPLTQAHTPEGVDASRSTVTRRLHLRVAAEVFADVWNDQAQRPPEEVAAELGDSGAALPASVADADD